MLTLTEPTEILSCSSRIDSYLVQWEKHMVADSDQSCECKQYASVSDLYYNMRAK